MSSGAQFSENSESFTSVQAVRTHNQFIYSFVDFAHLRSIILGKMIHVSTRYLEYLQKLVALVDEVDFETRMELMKIIANLESRRRPNIFRRRWDSEYLWNLAIEEGSFLAEYRMSPSHFEELHQILLPHLSVDHRMATLANLSSGSDVSSTMSRLGACLIMLAGGRYVESMRTHGLARSTAYETLSLLRDRR